MANKRIKDLATTATEADLVSGNYFALDGSAGTKKLPGDCIAPKSVQDNIVVSIAPQYDSATGAVAGGLYMHKGSLYICKEYVSGAWDATKFEQFDIGSNFRDQVKDGGSEFIHVITDAEGRVLIGVNPDATITFFVDTFFKNLDVNVVKKFTIESNPEFTYLIKDLEGRVVFGLGKDGVPNFGDKSFFETIIRDFLSDYVLSHMAFGVFGPLSYTVFGMNSDGAKRDYCTSFGWSNQKNNTGVKNSTFGSENLQWCSGHDNTAVGYHSQYRTTSGKSETSVGSESMDDNTTGNHNTATGYCALQRNNTGGENTATGAYALQGGYVAYDAENLKSFAKNVADGYAALGGCLTGTEKSVAVGNRALPSARAYKNCIGIGCNVDCDEDNMTVIGNNDTEKTVVRGDFFVKAMDGTTRQIVFNLDGTCSWVFV